MPIYTLRGVEVQFPYEAYQCQLDYMERVLQALQEGKNALLESPTGTGKTLCLLCAALAWQESLKVKRAAAQAAAQTAMKSAHGGDMQGGEDKTWAAMMKEGLELMRDADGVLPTIIYASRTHSQLAQVMGELNNSGYRPRTAVLGSRQQLCLHPRVSTLSGGAANQACRALVASRTCSWYTKVQPYAQQNPDQNGEMMDIEDLNRLGRVRGPCPFYLSREMAATANIIFMPYNYLVDGKIRGGLQTKWENAVLIFDEAHNIEGVCSDAGSFDLTGANLGAAIQEVLAAVEVALVRRDNEGQTDAQGADKRDGPNYFVMVNDFRGMAALLRKLEDKIKQLADSAPREGFTRPGPFLFDLLASIGLKAETLGMMLDLMDKAKTLLADEDAQQTNRRKGGGVRLEELADMLRLAFSTAEPSAPGRRAATLGYRVHIHKERAMSRGPGTIPEEVPTLSYWCFEPGVAMRALEALKVRCVLLTSGTLSPLDSFAQELQLDFPISLENPHVIAESQVWVGVMPVGPSGHALNSSYNTRDTAGYKKDLGMALANWARVVPDGLLVFFPSYRVLEMCVDFWKGCENAPTSVREFKGTLWDDITKTKQAVIEPKASSQFPAAADDYAKKLKDPSSRGAIFFAVCRGKVSEGLDFSDRAGRAVIITGLPYPMKEDPKVKLKRQVLDESRSAASSGKRGRDGSAHAVARLSGQEWYAQQATRAVNQAMGRVIRHQHDYGAIILADERFRDERTQRQVSKWLRPRIGVQPNFGACIRSLGAFFDTHRELKAPLKAAKLATRAPAQQNAFLQGGRTPGAAGSSWGPQPARPRAAGLDPLLATLSSVTAAVDASGLPELPRARGSLMTALQRPGQARPEAGQARLPGSARQADDVSLLDNLSAQLDGRSGAASARGLVAPAQRPLRESSRPSALSRMPTEAGKQRAQHAGHSIAHQSSSGSGNVCGPAHLVAAHAKRMQQSRAPAGVPVENMQPTSTSSRSDASGLRSSGLGHQQSHAAGVRGVGQRMPGGVLQSSRENLELAHTRSTSGHSQPGVKTKVDPKAYNDQLKAELPAEAYEAVRKALKAFKESKDSNALVDKIVDILKQPGRHHLLSGFGIFLPRDGCAHLRNCIRELVRPHSSAGGKLPASAAGALPPNTAGRAGVAQDAAGKPAESAAAAACTVCQKCPMDAAWAAPCAHLACWSCWQQALQAKHACPCCAAPAQRQQLRQKFFA